MFTFLLFVVWTAAMHVLYKANLHFQRFVLGSTGFFCFLMYAGIRGIEKYLQYAVTGGISIIGKILGGWSAYPGHSLVMLDHNRQSISFYIDYEASGVVEILVYISLLLFNPVFGGHKKIKYILLGTAYIFTANLIKVVMVCICVKLWGDQFLLYIHMLGAKLLFFIFMVGLYYESFTKPQILSQKVGGI